MTHLSFNGYCVKAKWKDQLPSDAVFISFGRLVNPAGRYRNCKVVAIYHSSNYGYGFK